MPENIGSFEFKQNSADLEFVVCTLNFFRLNDHFSLSRYVFFHASESKS